METIKLPKKFRMVCYDIRLWAVAGPTQVRPMTFFEDLNLRDFIMEESTLRKIREAAYIDDGSQTRK